MRFGRRHAKVAAAELVRGWELPHFPASTLRVLELLRDEESSLTDVAESLHADPGLTVRVLALVNSAGLSRGQKVNHLAQAIHLLGRAALESLVISVGLADVVTDRPRGSFEPARFWHRAALRAGAARALAGLVNPADRSRAFTAALLQDMAVPLLVERLGDRYEPVLQRFEASEGELHDLEREVFGWDHARVGFCMCEHWGLPGELAESIRDHHEPDAEQPAPEHLAALLDPRDDPVGIDGLLERAVSLGLDRDSVEEAIASELAQADATAALFA